MTREDHERQERVLNSDLEYSKRQLKVYELALTQYLYNKQIGIIKEDNSLYKYMLDKVIYHSKCIKEVTKKLIILETEWVKSLEQGEAL